MKLSEILTARRRARRHTIDARVLEGENVEPGGFVSLVGEPKMGSKFLRIGRSLSYKLWS